LLLLQSPPDAVGFVISIKELTQTDDGPKIVPDETTDELMEITRLATALPQPVATV
jgi:hypothetical protein